jgi:perosamine synthetase
MKPIYKPFMPDGILSGIEEILYSGNLSYGKYGKLFEQQLGGYIGNQLVLTTISYNQAMLVALSVLDLKSGDEIIASPVSCLASNQPFVTKGLKVVWADVNPETGALDPKDVERRITSNTKAIFHNHFCGYLGQIDDVISIARDNGIFVVDDCIEAFGSTYKGVKAGGFSSDISVFSFQTVRLPNTIDGGALAFSNEVLYQKAIRARDYGIDRTNFRNSIGEINSNCDIKEEGFGGTMSEINSFIGIKQMDELPRLLEIQKKNAEKWREEIANIPHLKYLTPINNTEPNYWVCGLLSDTKEEDILNFRNQGWYATGVHINNNIYSVFKNHENLKGVNEFIKKFVAVPCGWWI